MNIKELRAKIETEPKISLGKVYDEIMYTDMFVIKSKLEKLVFKANNRGGTDNISIAYLVKEESHD